MVKKKVKDKRRTQTITLTRTQIKRLRNETMTQAIILMLACCMDEWDFTDEDIVRFSKRFDRYCKAVNDHLLTIQQVAQILHDETGIRVDVKEEIQDVEKE